MRFKDSLNGYLTIPPEYSAMIDILGPSGNGSGVDNLDNFQFHFMQNLNADVSFGYDSKPTTTRSQF